MNKAQFTEQELDYINEDVFDSTQDIYAYAKYENMPKFLPNRYTIVCKNLPIGTYTLKGKNIDLHFNTIYMLVMAMNALWIPVILKMMFLILLSESLAIDFYFK